MGLNQFAHTAGDAINAILAAADYHFRLILNCLRLFLLMLMATISSKISVKP